MNAICLSAIFIHLESAYLQYLCCGVVRLRLINMPIVSIHYIAF